MPEATAFSMNQSAAAGDVPGTAVAGVERPQAASAKQPTDAYWHLYRLVAQRRLGQKGGGVAAELGKQWPAPLVALLEGWNPADGVFTHATTPGRRAEALFLLGALAAARGDHADAAARWKEVVAIGPVALIEYAAARNELAKS